MHAFFSRIDNNRNLSLQLKTFIKFSEAKKRCQEKLYIETSRFINVNCSQPEESRYQNKLFSLNTEYIPNDKILTFNYSKISEDEGGKFTFQVESWYISISYLI